MTSVVERIRDEFGMGGIVLSERTEVAAYDTDWTKKFSGETPCICLLYTSDAADA